MKKTRNSKTYLLPIATAAMVFASMIIPAVQIKVFLFVAVCILLFFNARRNRAIKREEEVIILSEDEVQYSTREKQEPVIVNKATQESTEETARKTTRGATTAQGDVAEKTKQAGEKNKTSAYEL